MNSLVLDCRSFHVPRTPRSHPSSAHTPPSSATMPRGGSSDSKKFFHAKAAYSLNDNNNSLDQNMAASPGGSLHSSRRSMYDSTSMYSTSSQEQFGGEDRSSPYNSRMYKSPMPPPRLPSRRSDLGSISSPATVESSQSNTNSTPPPEIPAKTYKFPPLPAS